MYNTASLWQDLRKLVLFKSIIFLIIIVMYFFIFKRVPQIISIIRNNNYLHIILHVIYLLYIIIHINSNIIIIINVIII